MMAYLLVNLPTSVTTEDAQLLQDTAYDRKGITIVTPTGVKIDVDLIDVEMVNLNRPVPL